MRAEPRFTRDIDLAVAVDADADAEALVRDLAHAGLKAITLVEPDVQKRRDDQRRPQDTVDLHALLEVADATEIARAEEALDLITARGFHRGRDLREALAAARR